MTQPLGVYLHIPFCTKKCGYCDFYSLEKEDASEGIVEKYVASLIEHIKEYALYSSGYKIDTLYIGGGTPSFIGGENIADIIKAVKKSFSIDNDIEITVELNPETTDVYILKKLFKVGVNRLSFGIQSSNDEQLKSIGRVHNYKMAKDAVLIARAVGFKNISIDLMYGFANQTMRDLRNDLENFLDLEVSHISTYCLKLEEGTKMFLENPTLPSDDEVADMYEFICETLKKENYSHYEVSNFAKEGFESKHNNKYWDLSEYLGLGPSAYSFFGSVRAGFDSDINEYMNNRLLSEKEEPVPLQARFGEYVMLKLRTKDGIDLSEYFGLFKKEFKFDDKFINSGHAKYENGRYFLTEKGFYISNYIINELRQN